MDNVIFFLNNFFNWTSSFTLGELVSTFWYLFLITIPRYYILEWIVMFWRFITRKEREREEQIALLKLHLDYPFVSIIVPGKNEGGNIYKLARSLKEQTFQNFEIVIIDDASDDNTSVICKNLQNSGYIDRFLSLNLGGGKASAANFGLDNNKAKFIVHLDADSSLDRDAIEQILMPFYLSDKIKAVGGCIKVHNTNDNFCTRLQALEYLESIMVGRTVNSTLGIYRTISGAFGAFDLAILKSVGAWDIGPGLDGDITQKIRKAGWKVHFNHKAICLTNVPTTFPKLHNQRLRWAKSLVRFRMRRHRDVLDVRSANFNISNFISNIDNILFNFILDYTWIFYMLALMVNNINLLPMLFVLNFLIMLPFRGISFAICMLVSERSKSEFYLIRIVPVEYFYQVIYLRINRLIAGISELFFFSSYKDSWNPKKVSDQGKLEQFEKLRL